MQAIPIDSKASKSYFDLGSSHATDGKTDKAEECYRRAIELDPTNVDALINLGSLLNARKAHTEANRCFEQAIDLANGDAALHSSLGVLLAMRGRLDDAQRCLRKAVLLDPVSTTFQINLANFLAASQADKDKDEAKSLFLAVIKIEPQHLEAWNNLGTLLFDTGYTSAANTAFTAAITFHPNQVVGHINLANIRLQMDDLDVAEKHFQIALDLSPGLIDAHRGLANLYQKRGDEQKARHHRDHGFLRHNQVSWSYRGSSEPIPLVVLSSSLDGNTPWKLLIDSTIFETTFIAVEYIDKQFTLPPHQLLFNAIGDADLCTEGLEIANRLVLQSSAPIINAPGAVQQTGRLMNATRLAHLPGVKTARIALVSKDDYRSGRITEMLAHNEVTFPFLIRAPGFHGGNHFMRVENLDELSNAIDVMPGDSVFVMEYLDAHADDSLFRKYRVMSINGAFYPVHMAISTQWKVHYFSSDMEDNVEFRQEEQLFLNDFTTCLGADAMTALARIAQTIGLDYFGMDFGIDKKSGNILLYEANSTMVVCPPPLEPRWDYRRAAIDQALAAARKMFIDMARIKSI